MNILLHGLGASQLAFILGMEPRLLTKVVSIEPRVKGIGTVAWKIVKETEQLLQNYC